MEEERARKKLLILYATQTGNALDVAERVSREAERRGCPVHLISLDQYDARFLAQEGTVIFVVSTTGQGDTPDPMKGFWKDLLQKNLSRQWLEGLRYAVFGLGDSGYQKFNVKNEPLTKSGCKDKEVHHFEFEFVSSPIPYEVGDVLEVLPGQNPAAVDAFILRCNLDPESFITVHPSEMENQLPDTCIPIKLNTFVELTMDVASASRRCFFEVMSMFASAEHEKERLKYFVSPEGRDDLYQYNQREQRTVLVVLGDFPSVQLPFEWLIQLVPPLKGRAFFISSSPSAHLNQVHLTVNVVSWTTLFKTIRAGLCSNWLSKLDPEQCVYVPVWFQKGSLPPPRPSLPLILIGPGTGCAPFRGFVEERAIQSLTESTGPVIFFFGCRN